MMGVGFAGTGSTRTNCQNPAFLMLLIEFISSIRNHPDALESKRFMKADALCIGPYYSNNGNQALTRKHSKSFA